MGGERENQERIAATFTAKHMNACDVLGYSAPLSYIHVHVHVLAAMQYVSVWQS